MSVLINLFEHVGSLFARSKPAVTVVRRYMDMNGRYVGELYIDGKMVGASLDNLPADRCRTRAWRLDIDRSFLEPLGWRTVRVGGMDPADDPWARKIAKTLPYLGVELRIENGFVLELSPGKGDTQC